MAFDPPASVADYLGRRLADAGAATRAILWDPARAVFACEELIDDRGRSWLCLPFDGDRTALLRHWAERPEGARIVIVASPPVWDRARVLDLSYLPAIASELELLVDLRLERILSECSGVVWQAAALAPVASLIEPRLGATLRALRQLQEAGVVQDAVNRATARAVALAAALPGEPPAAFLPSRSREAWATLADYLRRALDPQTPPEAQPHLRALAQEEAGDDSPLGRALAVEREQFAAAVYVLVLTAGQSQVAAGQALDALFGPASRPMMALKSLRAGLVPALRAAPGFVEFLDRQAEPWIEAETLAESVLGAAGIAAPALPAALGGLPPRAAEALAVAVVRRLGERGLDDLLRAWDVPAKWRPQAEPDAGELIVALPGLAAVLRALDEPEPAGGVGMIAKAWAASRLPLAETWLSAIRERFIPQAPTLVRPLLTAYIAGLRGRVRTRIDTLDRRLAAELSSPGALEAYHRAPFALAAALREFRPAALPAGAALFVVLMDCMRLDTWRMVVKPALEREFALQREEWRLATLPSITTISRTAFFAGAQPDAWRSASGASTRQESDLVATNLGIGDRHSAELLFEVEASEHPEHAPAPAEARRPFSVLVYNVCDNLVHEARGSLWQLQQGIAASVRDRVVPDLLRRVRDGDMVIVASDHGFMALDPADAEEVDLGGAAEQERETINYRYLSGSLAESVGGAGPLVDWGNAGRYRPAVGRRWFRRPGGTAATFAHGGLSLQELTVPIALLARASAPLYRLRLARAGSAPRAIEGEAIAVRFLARNAGNRPLAVVFEARDPEYRCEPSQIEIGPGSEQEVLLSPVTPLRPGSHRVRLYARYAASAGEEGATGEESLPAELTVEHDPRRVEQSSALDIFDREINLDNP